MPYFGQKCCHRLLEVTQNGDNSPNLWSRWFTAAKATASLASAAPSVRSLSLLTDCFSIFSQFKFRNWFDMFCDLHSTAFAVRQQQQQHWRRLAFGGGDKNSSLTIVFVRSLLVGRSVAAKTNRGHCNANKDRYWFRSCSEIKKYRDQRLILQTFFLEL